jgi:hypothetical protein
LPVPEIQLFPVENRAFTVFNGGIAFANLKPDALKPAKEEKGERRS